MTSQINPNNIDGNYPVAGVPNNTQGFRDNFANTKTNFQYAADEIDELQSKAVLKAALDGTTLDNNLNDNVIYAAQLRDISYSQVTLTQPSGSVNLDFSAGNFQSIPLSSGSVSLSFSNWPAAGTAGVLRFSIGISNPAHTLTLPAAVNIGTEGIQGYSANVITFVETGTYEFEFSTNNGGSSITIVDLVRALRYFTNAVEISNTSPTTSTTTGALIVAGGIGVAGDIRVGGNIVGNLVVTTQTFTGNLTGGNLNTGGVVSAAGNIISGNVATGIVTAATLSLSGNVVTPLNVTGNVTGGNIQTAGQVSAGGNVTGTYIIGDGSFLTNLTIAAGTAIVNGNSNVRVNANSNVVVGVGGTSNVVVWAPTGEYVTGLISANGNITGGNIRTNGIISAGGNLTASDTQINGAISATGTIGAIGNITGGNIRTIGIISAGGNIIGGNLNAVGLSLSGNVVSPLNVTGNVAGGNINSTGLISTSGNITGGNINSTGLISTSGNITGGYVLGNGSLLTGIATTTRLVSGTTELAIEAPSGNIQGSVGGTANVVVFTPTGANVKGYANITGNLLSGNISTTGLITATGNVTGGNVLVNGLISASGNVTCGFVNATGNVSLTGNVIAGNLTTSTGAMVAVGNIRGGNLLTDGAVVALTDTVIPAGGSAGKGYLFSSPPSGPGNFGIFFGSGAPTLSAAQGSLYLRSDGSTTNDRMYVNTNGTTGWTPVITST
jgi:hypothetical protein